MIFFIQILKLFQKLLSQDIFSPWNFKHKIEDSVNENLLIMKMKPLQNFPIEIMVV